MECFNQESEKSLTHKKLWIHEHIGNAIIDLVMQGRWLRNMNESELSIFNKKLEKISDLIEKLK